MPALYNQVIIQYRDKNGKMATSFWTTVDQDEGAAAEYATLAGLAQNVSDAAIVSVQFQQTLNIEATPADGPYCTVFDRCMVLSSIPATLAPVTFGLIAPTEDIFLPDNLTLDLANDDIIALQGEMAAQLGDRLGHAQGPFRRGYRTRSRGN